MRVAALYDIHGIFPGVEAGLVVRGHTHMQFDRMIGSVRVINVGSVGMPFGEHGACWLLLGPNIELRQTEYDLVRAANLVRRTTYPHADYFAEKSFYVRPPRRKCLRRSDNNAARNRHRENL